MTTQNKRNDLSNLVSKWFVFYVQPQCEKTVYKSLLNNGIECFLPLKKEYRQWSDRRKWIETPLISSYVFAKIKKEDYFNKIKFIKKIVKIVDIGGEIISIPETDIDWLKKISTSGYEVSVDFVSNLGLGDKAIIRSGPLVGLEGRVINELGKNKFIFELSLLKRILTIEISGEDLKKIGPIIFV